MNQKIFLLWVLITLLALPAQAQESTITRTLEHDGIQRSYRLHLPESTPQGLLIALHPFGSSARAMEILSDLNRLGEDLNYAIVYPSVAQYYWDDGRARVELPPAEGAVDDIGFINALIDTLTAEHDIDAANIWLTGYQNGGTMALALACQTSERFAGVAIVSALMWDYQVEDCGESTGTPLNIMFLHGLYNHIYRQEGRATGDPVQWRSLSIPETLTFWAQRNGCTESSVTENSLVITENFSDCDDNTTTTVLILKRGGHDWFRMDENTLNRSGVDATSMIGAWIAGDSAWHEQITEEARPFTMPRSYLVYVPESYDPASPAPLVMLLHGRGGSAVSQAYTSDMNRIAEREGFIALYPEGDDYLRNDPAWNYGMGIQFYGGDIRNDERFFDDLIVDLSHDLNIDMDRVYVTGYSNGGFMTQRLACRQHTRFAAFASVAATAPFGIVSLCNGAPPVPMLFIHGTNDRVVPWTGVPTTDPSTGTRFFLTAPMETTMGFWAQHNQCEPAVTETPISGEDPDSDTVRVAYNGCDPTAPLELYAVLGGGHAWHGIRETTNPIIGEINMDFNASEVIWEFFSQHTISERETP